MYMTEQISTVPGLQVYPSRANFLFVELPDEISGRSLRDRLLRNYGLLVRECSNKMGASEQYLRLAVQGKTAVDSLLRALQSELSRSAQLSAVAMS
jgi:histidinol-phosphate/aromatic aminotransferase/cobyric acid decarboxylase-like protein